jgi:hypothetical protein
VFEIVGTHPLDQRFHSSVFHTANITRVAWRAVPSPPCT